MQRDYLVSQVSRPRWPHKVAINTQQSYEKQHETPQTFLILTAVFLTNINGQLGCSKWECSKWGLKGCLAALPPKSTFFALFLPFSPISGGCKEHLKNQETEERRPFSSEISSDLLKPPSLKPPFAALQANSSKQKFAFRTRVCKHGHTKDAEVFEMLGLEGH